MKMSYAFGRRVALFFCALVLNHPFALAQIYPEPVRSVPTVTLHVPDPYATQSGNPATFEVDREGPTNAALNIFFKISGTASNGVDYALIPNFVTVPAGMRSASVTIKPIVNSNAPLALTVTLQLVPSELFTPGGGTFPVNYIIGSPNNGTAYIFNDVIGSNIPPIVNLIAPPDGASYYAPTNIGLFAKAFDLDGSVSNVEFFANNQDLGAGQLLVLDPPGIGGTVGPVYYFDWTNPVPGQFALTAVATVTNGASTTSSPVNISVFPPAPTVKITSPTNDQIFTAPLNISLAAIASSSNADVVRVDFFADDHFVGKAGGTNLPEYDTIWSNTPPGFYGLRAVATDSFGGKGVSDLVRIAVLGTNLPPPPSLPFVTIRALDPLAVVGTNCLVCYSNSPVASIPNFRSITNTASFVVRRSGDTNLPLVVYYSISGTASNGQDYVTLPGSVTIPTSRFTAQIVITPLDSDVPECPETVVLSLQAPTNVPPTYLVGWPDRAAAVIVDCDSTPPPTALLCTGQFHFYFPPVSTAPYYRLECSLDLVHWLPVCTNTASLLGIHFIDPQSPDFPNLYYRALPDAIGSGVLP